MQAEFRSKCVCAARRAKLSLFSLERPMQTPKAQDDACSRRSLIKLTRDGVAPHPSSNSHHLSIDTECCDGCEAVLFQVREVLNSAPNHFTLVSTAVWTEIMSWHTCQRHIRDRGQELYLPKRWRQSSPLGPEAPLPVAYKGLTLAFPCHRFRSFFQPRTCLKKPHPSPHIIASGFAP